MYKMYATMILVLGERSCAATIDPLTLAEWPSVAEILFQNCQLDKRARIASLNGTAPPGHDFTRLGDRSSAGRRGETHFKTVHNTASGGSMRLRKKYTRTNSFDKGSLLGGHFPE